MSIKVTLKDHPEVKRVILAAFPSYRKLTASVVKFGPKNINSYWDGGSRSEYRIVDMTTMQSIGTPASASHPYFDVVRAGLANQGNEVVKVDHVGNVTLLVLPPDCALVEAGIFCGKPATASVYVNEANLTKLLPKSATNALM